MLLAGDMFVTKHSNFNWIHLMMHILACPVTPKAMETEHELLMNGLKQTLRKCHSLGVQNVFLQIPFTSMNSALLKKNKRNKGASSEVIILTQLEDTLRAIQQEFEQANKSPFFSIKNVILFAPPLPANALQFCNQTQQLVSSVFPVIEQIHTRM